MAVVGSESKWASGACFGDQMPALALSLPLQPNLNKALADSDWRKKRQKKYWKKKCLGPFLKYFQNRIWLMRFFRKQPYKAKWSWWKLGKGPVWKGSHGPSSPSRWALASDVQAADAHTSSAQTLNSWPRITRTTGPQVPWIILGKTLSQTQKGYYTSAAEIPGQKDSSGAKIQYLTVMGEAPLIVFCFLPVHVLPSPSARNNFYSPTSTILRDHSW